MGVAAFLAACGTKGTAATASPERRRLRGRRPRPRPPPAPSATASAGASASASAAPSATPAEAMIPTGTPGNVTWANWPLYIDVDKNGKHPTIQAFEAKYNVKVTYKEVINDNEQFFGKIKPNLQAGQPTGWDLITMTDWMAARLIRLGWTERFDPSAMPNFTPTSRTTTRASAGTRTLATTPRGSRA